MKRPFAFMLAALAAFAFTCSTADAHWKRKTDRRVKAVQIGAGVASTVAYGSIVGWSTTKYARSYQWGAAGAVTLGCVMLAPAVAQILVPERSLTYREVYGTVGGCIVPIIGTWLVNKAFDDHPEWDKIALEQKKMRKKK